jgi:hypothetical protein
MKQSEKNKDKTIKVVGYMRVGSKEQLSPEALKRYLEETTEKPQKGEK